MSGHFLPNFNDDTPQHNKVPIRVTRRGSDILHDPLFNKGDAFAYVEPGERDRLRIRGLIPPRRLSMEEQMNRFLMQLDREDSNIKKNLMLEDLHDNNETLYHRVLVNDVAGMAPLVYTPTVGQACVEFADRYRRPRGMYFTRADRGAFAAMVYNWPRDVRVIVVTDGSRILGLGDLGANGMGIPIGKLSLYCAAGGIPPHRVMPCLLDVGTNNEKLIEDPFYLGVKEPRLRGDEFYAIVDEFMAAVNGRWPNVLVQFEDFSSDVAQTVLNEHRDKFLCFNDDIQGTGATTTAGLMGALRAIGQKPTDLHKQRIFVVGAGSAGIGISQTLVNAIVMQGSSAEHAYSCFHVFDQHGLLGEARLDTLNQEQKPFACKAEDKMSLLDAIKEFKPTVLIGVTSVAGLFNEDIVKAMASGTERPIIFALSNPTSRTECTAEQAYTWSEGKCIYASGSPFDPVTLPDGTVKFASQCNNFYLFPGLGLGGSICAAKKITDEMIIKGATALAEFTPDEEVKCGKLFPPKDNIREGSKHVATAVVKEAWEKGLTRSMTAEDAKDIFGFVESKMYFPEYVPLIEKRTVIL